MSNSQTPQDNSSQQSFKRQLPFSSMKPPFLAPGDYHRFAAEPRRRSDQEVEAIVVKSPVSLSYKAVLFSLNFAFLGFI